MRAIDRGIQKSARMTYMLADMQRAWRPLIWNPDEPRQSPSDRAAPGEPPPECHRGLHGPIPQLLSDRTDCRGPDRHHALSDLVVRDLGRRSGSAVRADRLPAGNLSAVRAAGLGA